MPTPGSDCESDGGSSCSGDSCNTRTSDSIMTASDASDGGSNAGSDVEFECDACGDAVPDRAPRFRCLLCKDFDLCAECNEACQRGNLAVGDHDSSHPVYAASAHAQDAALAPHAAAVESRQPLDDRHGGTKCDPGKLAALCKAALEGAGISTDRLSLATGLDLAPEATEFSAFHRLLGAIAAVGPHGRSARGGVPPPAQGTLGGHGGSVIEDCCDMVTCSSSVGAACRGRLQSLWDRDSWTEFEFQQCPPARAPIPGTSCLGRSTCAVQPPSREHGEELAAGDVLCSLSSSIHLGSSAAANPLAVFWVQSRFAGDVPSVSFPEAELVANRDPDAAGARTIDLLLAGECPGESIPSCASPASFAGVAALAPGKWRCQIWVEGRVRNIGTYATELLAAEAHDCAIRLATAMWQHLAPPAMKREPLPPPIQRLRDSWLASKAASLSPEALSEVRATASSMICEASGRPLVPVDELNFAVANAAIRQRLETATAVEFLHYQVSAMTPASSTREASDWFATGLSPAVDADHPAPATSSWSTVCVRNATSALSAIALGECWVAAGRSISTSTSSHQCKLGSLVLEAAEPADGWTAATQARSGIVASAWASAWQDSSTMNPAGPKTATASARRHASLSGCNHLVRVPSSFSGGDATALQDNPPSAFQPPIALEWGVGESYELEATETGYVVISEPRAWVRVLAKLSLAKLLALHGSTAMPYQASRSAGHQTAMQVTPASPPSQMPAGSPLGDGIEFIVRAAASRGLIPMPLSSGSEAPEVSKASFPGGLHPRTSALVPCLKHTLSRLGHTEASGASLMGCRAASLAAWLARKSQPWPEFHDICDKASSLLRLCRRRSGFQTARRKRGKAPARVHTASRTRQAAGAVSYGFEQGTTWEGNAGQQLAPNNVSIREAQIRWRTSSSKPAANRRATKRVAASRNPLPRKHKPTIVHCNGTELQTQPGLPGEADDARTLPMVWRDEATSTTVKVLTDDHTTSKVQVQALARVLFADYARCTVCGISGDFSSSTTGSARVATIKCVKCGCSVHSHCYLLDKHPSGPWTCEVCVAGSFPTELVASRYRASTTQAMPSPAGCAVCHLPPRGLACKPCRGDHGSRWAHVVCLLSSKRADRRDGEKGWGLVAEARPAASSSVRLVEPSGSSIVSTSRGCKIQRGTL